MTNVITMQGRAGHASTMTFEERNDLLKKLAREAGLRLPDTILPEGHALWDVGEQAKRKLERSISQLPDVNTALNGLLERIRLEDPKDYSGVVAQQIRMNPTNGRLFGEGKSPAAALGYTPSGFNHITQAIRPDSVRQGYQSVLLSLPPAIRADAFNFHAKAKRAKDNVTLRTIVEPASGATVIRAVTSSKHSLETGDDRMVAQTLLNTPSLYDTIRHAKARITRQQDRSEFELIWPAMERQLSVGDICYIGVRIRNSETKNGSLEVEVFVLRVLCANFTTAFSKDNGMETISIRHMGDLRHKLVDAFSRALSRAAPFVHAFSDAYKNAFPEGKTRGEILTALGKATELPGYLLQSASDLWDADGVKSAGDTLAGLVNALSRAAKEQTIDDATETERVAGDLVRRKWAVLG